MTTMRSLAAPAAILLLLAAAAAVEAQLRVEDVAVEPTMVLPEDEAAAVSFTVSLDCQSLVLYGGPGDLEAELEYNLNAHVSADLPASVTLPFDDCGSLTDRASAQVTGTLDVARSAPGLAVLINRVQASVEPTADLPGLETLTDEQRMDVLAKYMQNLEVRVLEDNISVRSDAAVASVELASRSNAQARWSMTPVSVSFDDVNESTGIVQVPPPVVLGTPNDPEEREPLEVLMTVRLEVPEGFWREATVVVELRDAPTFRPDEGGDPIRVDVVFRNPAAQPDADGPDAEESPGPAALPLLIGLLAAAGLAARSRRTR